MPGGVNCHAVCGGPPGSLCDSAFTQLTGRKKNDDRISHFGSVAAAPTLTNTEGYLSTMCQRARERTIMRGRSLFALAYITSNVAWFLAGECLSGFEYICIFYATAAWAWTNVCAVKRNSRHACTTGDTSRCINSPRQIGRPARMHIPIRSKGTRNL